VRNGRLYDADLGPRRHVLQLVSKIPAVRLPIRVLTTKANGWHDLGVVERKSGNEPLYESVLSFTGTSYPYLSDGLELRGKFEGKIVMPATAKSRPLYH